MSTQMSSLTDGINGMAIDTDGKITAVGYAGNDAGIVRLKNSTIPTNTIEKALNLKSDFELFPNPATTNYLTMVSKTPLLPPISIELMDLIGRKKQASINFSTAIDASFPITIPLINIAAGKYFIQVNSSKTTTTLPFIKQ